MSRATRVAVIGGVLSALFGIGTVGEAAAQVNLHGGTILKSCSVRAIPGRTASCTIRVVNADTFGHALRVDSIVDTVQHAGGAVASGNLLSSPTILQSIGDQV